MQPGKLGTSEVSYVVQICTISMKGRPYHEIFKYRVIRYSIIDIYIMHVHNKAKTYYGRYYDIQVEGRFEVSNITLSVDDDTIKKVRKIAIDKNTTLTAMVRDYLTSVAARDTQEKNEAIKKLRKSFKKFSRDIGQRKWSREDLHER
jgi:hypothetical protein